jgi:Protein of unknown function (DUF3349)/GAF domain/ANTAR domain
MARLMPVSRFVDFVRTGYPDGAPIRGYLPLFALLRRRLTDDEVAEVARTATQSGPPIMHTDIHSTITGLIGDTPLTDDADRVCQHLADSGWLVIDPSGRVVICNTRPTGGAASMTKNETEFAGPELVNRLAHMATEISAPASVEEVFAGVCAAAVELMPGADLADIMLLRDGEVVSIGATSELSRKLDELQQHLGEGPCAQAAGDTAVVRTDDFRTDPRWTRYATAALDLGVHSCLSFKLYSADRTAATMNIFGFGADVWDDDAEMIGATLAAHAAAAISASRWGSDMQTPLAARDRVGQAKGIIMERYGVDDIGAFEMLRRVCDEAGLPLVDIADRVIDTRTPSATSSRA